MSLVRKYFGYILFGAVVLLVVGLAVSRSRTLRGLVDAMAQGSPEAQKEAAARLIKDEQFMDSITGEPVETRIKAAEALEVLGDETAVKQCIAFLKDQDKPVREQVVKTLQKIGGNSEKNIKELVVGLKDGDTNVRKGTIRALSEPNGGIGPRPGVVNAIVNIMKAEAGARGPGGDVMGSDLFRRDEAQRKEAIALLVEQLKDKDEGVRGGAAEALGKIGDPVAIPPLKLALGDTAQVRRIALGSIALIADKSGEEPLTQAINNPDDDSEARAQAAVGLGKIGTPTAIATLVRALGDDDLKLRSAAFAALARAARPTPSSPVNTPVLNALIAATGDSRDGARKSAIEALKVVAAPEANPALLRVLTDRTKNAELRAAAARALGFPGNATAVTPLVQQLTDPDGDVGAAARDALAAIGPQATNALVAVIQKGGPEAFYAAQALSRHGAAALPALEKVASAANPIGQRWAAVALGDLGVPEARRPLELLAKSSDPDVAYVAREQLDHLGRAQ